MRNYDNQTLQDVGSDKAKCSIELSAGGSGTLGREDRLSRSGLERPGTEGKTPVGEKLIGPERIPSTTGHVEPRGNPGGPPPKAKYSLATDSERVP